MPVGTLQTPDGVNRGDGKSPMLSPGGRSPGMAAAMLPKPAMPPPAEGRSSGPVGTPAQGAAGADLAAGDSSRPAAKGELTVGRGRFVLKRRLGSGSFGDVYEGWDKSKSRSVAVKLEPQRARHPQLRNEVRIYRALNGMRRRQPGFSRLFWDGEEGDFNVMVMEMLGPSLETLFDYCNRRFTLKTVLMLADQMLRRVEALHCLTFIHRDIKPENFVLGRGQWGHHVYLIDYGLSKRYWNVKADAHCDYAMERPLIGTARYSSLHTHLGVEQSRRDDLESLAYVWMYFLKGSLPWMGIQAEGNDDKIRKIGEKKESTSIDTLCKGEQTCWRKYLRYVRTMQYEEQPEYTRLRKLLRRTLEEEGEQLDWQFDWMVKRRGQLVTIRKTELREQKRAAKRKAREEKRAAGFAGQDAENLFNDEDDDWDVASSCSSAAGDLPEVPFAVPGTLTRNQEDHLRTETQKRNSGLSSGAPDGNQQDGARRPSDAARERVKSSPHGSGRGGRSRGQSAADAGDAPPQPGGKPPRSHLSAAKGGGKGQGEGQDMSHSTSFAKVLAEGT